jgi:hypothetical protein
MSRQFQKMSYEASNITYLTHVTVNQCPNSTESFYECFIALMIAMCLFIILQVVHTSPEPGE